MKVETLKRLVKSRSLRHLMFWGLSWYLLLRIFSYGEVKAIDLIYTTFFIIPIAGSVYINLLILIPKLLQKGIYVWFLLSLAFTVAAFTWLNMVVFEHLIDLVLPGFYFISYYDYADLLKFFIPFILITTLLKLSKGWFELMETRTNLERLEKEHAKAELETLKGQVNPHFLFNSLNTLYSLVIKKSDGAGDYILKLSGLLRYLLYETTSAMVDLEKELQYITDYLELQKLRAGSLADIRIKIKGDPSGKTIAPLLFLPLIENSFKHGIKGETGPSFIDIDMMIDDHEIIFDIRNNPGYSESVEKGRKSGIGLENLRRRLQLVYPDRFSFVKSEDHQVFHVKLIVPLQDENEVSDR